MQTADLPCTDCGATDDEVLWVGREHEYNDTTDAPFPVVRCRQCGLVRLNPRPDVSELDRIYPPTYYAYNLHAQPPARRRGISSLTTRLKERVYQRRLAKVLARVEAPTGPIRVLDVGCADGTILDWYKASGHGSRIETHGIDFNERAVEVARGRGHRVVVGRFEEEDELERDAFHLILASHVIEHVAAPKAFARHARDLLAPGGIFVVATPNIASRDVRLFGRHWGGCHFPRHWTFYDAESIGRLAQSVGLEVDHVEYQPNPVFWIWTFHALLRDRFSSSSLPDRLFPPVRIFTPSPQAFVLLSFFTVVDLVLRTLTGKTASMAVTMRRPAGAGGGST